MASPFQNIRRQASNPFSSPSGLGPLGKKVRETMQQKSSESQGLEQDPEGNAVEKSEVIEPKRITHWRNPSGALQPIKAPSGANYIVRNSSDSYPRDPISNDPLMITEKGEVKSVYDGAPTIKENGKIYAAPAGFTKKAIADDPDWKPNAMTKQEQAEADKKLKADQAAKDQVEKYNQEVFSTAATLKNAENDNLEFQAGQQVKQAKEIEANATKDLQQATARVKALKQASEDGTPVDPQEMIDAQRDLETKTNSVRASSELVNQVNAGSQKLEARNAKEKLDLARQDAAMKLAGTARKVAQTQQQMVEKQDQPHTQAAEAPTEKSESWKQMQVEGERKAQEAGLPQINKPAGEQVTGHDRLKDAVERAKRAGAQIDSFIDSGSMPDGDRAPTMDQENLVKGLRQLQSKAQKEGKPDVAQRYMKEADYWENEVRSSGMTAEQWKAQTGESDPAYPIAQPARQPISLLPKTQRLEQVEAELDTDADLRVGAPTPADTRISFKGPKVRGKSTANQLMMTADGEWTDALAGEGIRKVTKTRPIADGTPETWMTPEAYAARQDARTAGTDEIYQDQDIEVKQTAIDKAQIVAKGKTVGEVRYDALGVPQVEMSRTAFGATASPSYRAANPFGGVPEWTSPSPAWKEAQGDRAAQTWQERRWAPEQVQDFIDQWQGAKDPERRKLLTPEVLKDIEDDMPSARQLYREGVVSLQQARMIDQAIYGRDYHVPDPAKAWEAWKRESTSDEARALREEYDAGNDRQKLALMDQAVSEWGGQYRAQHSTLPDFDPQAFNAEYQKLKGDANTSAQRIFGTIEEAGGSLFGSLLGMGQTAVAGTNATLTMMATLAEDAGLLSKGAVANEMLGEVLPGSVTGPVKDKMAKGEPLNDQEKLVAFQIEFAGGRAINADQLGYTFTPEKMELAANKFVQGWKNFGKDWMSEDTDPRKGVVTGFTGEGPRMGGNEFVSEKDKQAAVDLYMQRREAGTLEMTTDVDWLADKVNEDSLTPSQLKARAKIMADKAVTRLGYGPQDKEKAVRDMMRRNPSVSRAEHEANYDQFAKEQAERYDITNPKSPAYALFAAYNETQSPEYLALLKEAMYASKDGQEIAAAAARYASINGLIKASDSWAVLDMTRRGISVDPNEFLIETGSNLTQVGLVKALAGGARVFKASGQIGKAASAAGRASNAADRALARLIESAPVQALRASKAAQIASKGAKAATNVIDNAKTIGLRQGAPVRNAMVQGGKIAVMSSTMEGAEEYAASTMEDVKTLDKAIEQTAMGALAGLIGAGVTGAAGVGLSALDTMKKNAARQKAYTQFSEQWNERNPLQPITAQDASAIHDLLDRNSVTQIYTERQALLKEIAQTEGPPTPEQAARLITSYGRENKIVHMAKQANDEIGAVGDPKTQAFIKASMRVLMGQPLTTMDQQALGLNDVTGRPLITKAGSQIVWTDAGLELVAQATPGIRAMFFPESQEKQELDILNQPPTNGATESIPGSDRNSAEAIQPNSKTGSASNVSRNPQEGDVANISPSPSEASRPPANDTEAQSTKEFAAQEFDEMEFLGEGSESEVYRQGDKVYKKSEAYNEKESLAERVTYALRAEKLLGNASGLRYVGYWKGKNGVLNPVFEQTYTKGKQASPEQIKELFESNGWTQEKDGSYSIVTPEGKVQTLSDLNDDNVLVSNGKVIPVDVATTVTPVESKTVDEAANEAATSPTNDRQEPTEAQKKAGNYKVGKVNVAGLGISIENPMGSKRSGKDQTGKAWEVELKSHYGYIRNTTGADGDAIDVFVKPGTVEDWDGEAYVVEQINPRTGKFDEHKVMIGYGSLMEAQEAYLENYAKGWKGLKKITAMPVNQLAARVKSGLLKNSEPTRTPSNETTNKSNSASTQSLPSQASNQEKVRGQDDKGPTQTLPEGKGKGADNGQGQVGESDVVRERGNSEPRDSENQEQPNRVRDGVGESGVNTGSDTRPVTSNINEARQPTVAGDTTSRNSKQSQSGSAASQRSGGGNVQAESGREAAQANARDGDRGMVSANSNRAEPEQGGDGSERTAVRGGQANTVTEDDQVAVEEAQRREALATQGSESGAGESMGDNSSRSQGAWTIRTIRGETLSIPASEASDKDTAIRLLAAKARRGDLVQPETLQAPGSNRGDGEVATNKSIDQQIADIVLEVARTASAFDRQTIAGYGRLLIQAFRKHKELIERSFKGGVRVVSYDVPGGGLIVTGGDTLVISPTTFLNSMQLMPLNSIKEFVDRGFFHEWLHAVIMDQVDSAEAAEIWNALKPEIQQAFMDSYNLGNEAILSSDTQWGHEYLRAVMEQRHGAGTSEELFLNLPLHKRFIEAIKKVLAHLKDVLSGMKTEQGKAQLKELIDVLDSVIKAAKNEQQSTSPGGMGNAPSQGQADARGADAQGAANRDGREGQDTGAGAASTDTDVTPGAGAGQQGQTRAAPPSRRRRITLGMNGNRTAIFPTDLDAEIFAYRAAIRSNDTNKRQNASNVLAKVKEQYPGVESHYDVITGYRDAVVEAARAVEEEGEFNAPSFAEFMTGPQPMARPGAKPIGSGPKATAFIRENFGEMLSAMKIDLTTNYAGYIARHVVKSAQGNGYIEVNPMLLAEHGEETVMAVIREEIIHAKAMQQILKRGLTYEQFYRQVYDSMTEGQRKASKAVYRSAKTPETTASEYVRQVIQQRVYGTLTEPLLRGRARKVVEELIEQAQESLKAEAWNAAPQVRKQIAGVIDETVKTLQALDTAPGVQPMAAPTSIKARERIKSEFNKAKTEAEEDEVKFREDRFINDLSDNDLEEAYPDLYSDHFGNPTTTTQVVYHHTPSENAQSIIDNGLSAESRTRGLSNRGVGRAIFASAEEDPMNSYGDTVVAIDLGAARRIDKITTSLEPSIEESIRRRAVAYMLGVEDQSFEPDTSSGEAPDTLIIRGSISRDAIQVSNRDGELLYTGSEFRKVQPMAQPLIGLPSKAKIPGLGEREFGPWQTARDTAEAYMREAGLEYAPPRTYQKVDKARAERIAAEFDRMKHDPQDPAVAASYQAMIKETLAQWEAIKKTGLKVEPIRQGMDDPYAASPRLAQIDAVENNHLWFFPTDFGFGNDVTGFDPKDNPLFEFTGEEINGHKMRANDVFRIVHDYFGHFKEGVGFRADGEENAWRSHSSMYSPEARGAMTSETRGQNSWLNFGPYGEKNRTALVGDTVFADQKIGLMPEWTWYEGAGDPVQPMAKPSPDLLNKPFYHATSSESAGKAILESGEVRPPDNKHARGKLAPVVGKTYISKSPETASIYSIGGVMMGTDYDWRSRQGPKNDGQYGYVFEIDPESITDIQPDEDEVGELAFKVMDKRIGEVPEYENLYGFRSLAMSLVTEREKSRSYDYATWASLGKRMLKQMSDSQKLIVARMFNNLAVTGPVKFKRAWRVDKDQTKAIARDGSNLFEVAELVYGDQPMAAPAELNLGKKGDVEAMRQRNAKRMAEELNAKHPESAALEYRKDGSKFILDADGWPQVIPQEYKFDESELAKIVTKGKRGEARRAAVVKGFADKLVEFYEKVAKNPDVMAGREWYRVAREKLQAHFGEDTLLFSQLLAATSARTPVLQNFEQALDAYNKHKAGDYDGIADRYLKAVEDAAEGKLVFRRTWGTHAPGEAVTGRSLRDWLDSEGIIPRRSNGKKFNANSLQVLNVLAGVWREKLGGPKTAQFADNLSGADMNATIDVWAGRTMHRMGNEKFKAKWRIMPEAEQAVSKDDFALAQEAFAQAAKRVGMNPDDLQGVLWFGEKEYWQSKGWTRGAGAELSDFSSLLDSIQMEDGKKRLRLDKQQGTLSLFDDNDTTEAQTVRSRNTGAVVSVRGRDEGVGGRVKNSRSAAGRGSERAVAAAEPSLFMASPSPIEPGFYSQLERVIEAKMPNKGYIGDIMGIIKNSQVKAEELKWSGLEPWLAGKGQVTKDEVLSYLRTEGGVKFAESKLTEQRKLVARSVRTGNPITINGNAWEEIEAELQEDGYKPDQYIISSESYDEPMYSQYATPGGENYREVVVTGRTSPKTEADIILSQRDDEINGNPWVANMKMLDGSKGPQLAIGMNREEVKSRAVTELNNNQGSEYTSSHFSGVSNYIAHYRAADFKDGTLLEELQSDRHQEGRKNGYKEEYTPEMEARRRELLRIESMSIEELAEFRMLNELSDGKGPADAPYRTTWPLMLFKRALREAVETGKEWIGWTTGDTQADRFDLSKQIKSVKATRAGQDLYSIEVMDNYGSLVISETTDINGVESYIGKEIAKKIHDKIGTITEEQINAAYLEMEEARQVLKNETNIGSEESFETFDKYKTKQKAWDELSNATMTLSDLDLKVGGEGMKGFYDNILPKEIGKYVKQWGGKVTLGELPAKYEFKTTGQIANENGMSIAQWRDLEREERGALTRKSMGEQIPAWRVEITDTMRNSVKAGQPLYMAKPGPVSDPEGPAAANELMRMMMEELPSEDEMAAIRSMASLETPGNRSIGTPELANIRGSEAVRKARDVVSWVRDRDATPETVEEWLSTARNMARKADDVAAQVMQNYFDGAGHGSPELVLAASIVTARKFKEAILSGDTTKMREAEALAYADGAGRTQAARTLRAMHDPHQSPEERQQEFFAKLISTPSAKDRSRIAAAPSPMAKQREIKRLKDKIEELRKKIVEQAKAKASDETQRPVVEQKRKLDEELKKTQAEKDKLEVINEAAAARRQAVIEALEREGLTEEDVFVTASDRLSAQESEPVQEAIAMHPQEHRDAIRYIMRGYSHADVAQMTSLPRDTVAAIHQDFRQKSMKASLSKWVKRGNTMLDLIKSGARRLFGQQMAAPIPYDQARAQGKIAASNEVEIERQLSVLVPTAKQVNSGNMIAVVVNGKAGQTVTVKVPYSATDFRSAYRVARAISTSEASGFDKLYEFWIANLLSGPETNFVNVVGNLGSGAVHFLMQKPLEAIWNTVLRDPESQSWGELKHLAGGLLPGLREAFTLAALAFSTEGDPVGHRYLNDTIDLEFDTSGQMSKIGAYRGPAIAGLKGRIWRMPLRLLMAMDAFTKALIGNMEVGAQAYRIGKIAQQQGRLGNTPAELESFITSEINTPGSRSWHLSMDIATELAFQDDNWFTEIAKFFTSRSVNVENFQKKAIEAAKEGNVKLARRMKGVAIGFMALSHIMRFIFPFVRTPTNILRMGVRKSPFGTIPLAMEIARAFYKGAWNWSGKKAFWQDNERATLVKLFAEQTAAWATFMTVWGAGEGDDDDDTKKFLLVGGRPSMTTSPGERTTAYRDYGGTYLFIIRGEDGKDKVRFSFGRYEPFATILGTTIDTIREIKEASRNKRLGLPGGDPGVAMANIVGSLMSQTEDKSFFQGYANMMRLIDTVRRGGDMTTSLTESLMKQAMAGIVPNLIRQPIRNIDPMVRDTKDKADLWYNAIPLGKLAEPVRDIYGRPSEKGGTPTSRILVREANLPVERQKVERMITKWNTQHPDDKYQPIDLRRTDYWYYDKNNQRVMITDRKQRDEFEVKLGEQLLRMHSAYAEGKDMDNLPSDFKDKLQAFSTKARKIIRETFGKSAFEALK